MGIKWFVCLQEEVATAWKVIRTEPIVLRLRFSLSQYLDGPGEKRVHFCACVKAFYLLYSTFISFIPTEPSVDVFQPSNKEGFSLGLQLKK